MLPLTDSAPVPYSLLPLHCSHYSLCCLLSYSLSQQPYTICKQKHQRQSFALALPPSHTYTHAHSLANILLEQKSISSLQRLLYLSFSLARFFSFTWSFTVWRFLLGLWAHCDLQVEPARTTLGRLCLLTRLLCQKSLRNRFPTWLRIYSCCCFKLYKKTEMCLN